MTNETFHQVQAHLTAILKGYQFTFNKEKAFQDALEIVLTEHDIPFEREFILSERDRPDFLLTEHNIAVEVKIAGSIETHLRQMKRYADHERVQGVLLITSRNSGEIPATLSEEPIGAIALWQNRF